MEWLNIFFNYVFVFVCVGQYREVYVVCYVVCDFVVWIFIDNIFFIYVVWVFCVVYVGDEEICVVIVCYFMRDYCLGMDFYCMFLVMC